MSISSTLDSIADSLESKGFIKEARELDIISNTIELMGSKEVNPEHVANPIQDSKKIKEEKWNKLDTSYYREALSKVGYGGASLSEIQKNLYVDGNNPSLFYYLTSPEDARRINLEHGSNVHKVVDRLDIRMKDGAYYVYPEGMFDEDFVDWFLVKTIHNVAFN